MMDQTLRVKVLKTKIEPSNIVVIPNTRSIREVLFHSAIIVNRKEIVRKL